MLVTESRILIPGMKEIFFAGDEELQSDFFSLCLKTVCWPLAIG